MEKKYFLIFCGHYKLQIMALNKEDALSHAVMVFKPKKREMYKIGAWQMNKNWQGAVA